MRGHKFLLLTAIIFPVIFIFNCTTVNSFLPEDFCAKPINPSMARIDFTRRWQAGGGGITLRIFDNDQPIADLGPGAKICWDRFPGTALITARGAHHDNYIWPNWKIEVDSKANTIYYVSGQFFGKWSVSLTPE